MRVWFHNHATLLVGEPARLLLHLVDLKMKFAFFETLKVSSKQI